MRLASDHSNSICPKYTHECGYDQLMYKMTAGRGPRHGLADHVLPQEKWDIVRLSPIADNVEAYRVETVPGRPSFGRKARRTPSGSCAMTVR